MVNNIDDWKENWENYLKTRKDGDIEPLQLNLGEIDFYIPPLLGVDAESMNSIKKHNAKIGIF